MKDAEDYFVQGLGGGFHHTWGYSSWISRVPCYRLHYQSSRYISDRELVLVTGALFLFAVPTVAVHVSGCGLRRSTGERWGSHGYVWAGIEESLQIRYLDSE